MLKNTEAAKTHRFEVPFNARPGSQHAAKADAEECASLNPGATVRWQSLGGYYWHGAYVVTLP